MRQVVSITRVFHVVFSVMVLMGTTRGTVIARKLLQMPKLQQAPNQAMLGNQIVQNQPMQYVNQPLQGIDVSGITRYGPSQPGRIVVKQPLQYVNPPPQKMDVNGMTQYGPTQPGQFVSPPQQFGFQPIMGQQQQQLQRPDLDVIPMYLQGQVPPQQLKPEQDLEYQRALQRDLTQSMPIQNQRLTKGQIRAGLMYQAVPIVQRPIQAPIAKRAVIRRKARRPAPARRPRSPLKKLPLKRRSVKLPKARHHVQTKGPLPKNSPVKPAETGPKVANSE